MKKRKKRKLSILYLKLPQLDPNQPSIEGFPLPSLVPRDPQRRRRRKPWKKWLRQRRLRLQRLQTFSTDIRHSVTLGPLGWHYHYTCSSLSLLSHLCLCLSTPLSLSLSRSFSAHFLWSTPTYIIFSLISTLAVWTCKNRRVMKSLFSSSKDHKSQVFFFPSFLFAFLWFSYLFPFQKRKHSNIFLLFLSFHHVSSPCLATSACFTKLWQKAQASAQNKSPSRYSARKKPLFKQLLKLLRLRTKLTASTSNQNDT